MAKFPEEDPRESARRAARLAREHARKARRIAREHASEARRAASDIRTEEIGSALEHREHARRRIEKSRRVYIQGPRGAASVEVGLGPLRSGLISGSFFLVVGSAFLADSLGLMNFNPVYIWPLMAISLGISEVMGRSTRQKVEKVRTTQLAVAEERVRIARELHDIVAHSVSLMTVQIAAARRVFHKKPFEAQQALQAAESTGRQSLTELRNLVNILRSADDSIEAASFGRSRGNDETDTSAPLPGLGEVGGLVDGLKEAGMDVRLKVTGEPPATPPGVQLAVYRVLQEALTNTMRHGRSAPVVVEITYDRERIELLVENEIEDDSVQPKSEGHGVIGMRERVAAVGGSLEAGLSPDGRWRVHALIPTGGRS